MQSGTLNVSNKSVETSGITKDYKQAINEYIWNGFESGATKVTFSYEDNSVSGIENIRIKDNGTGVDHSLLDESFGNFLESTKIGKFQLKTHANKGKGRFSFQSFADLITWKTVYKNSDDRYMEYEISVNNTNKQKYYFSEPIKSRVHNTGTIAEISNINSLLPNNFEDNSFIDSIIKEFCWYLHLNSNYKLIINNKSINYNDYLNSELSKNVIVNIDNIDFNIDIAIWDVKINQNAYIYCFDLNNNIKHKETTSFNKNSVDFNHSVVVKSSYDNYSGESEDQTTLFADPKTYIKLKKEIRQQLDKIFTKFLASKADEKIETLKENESFPNFSDMPYDQLRKKDLERVTKEIFVLEPRIFYKLKPIQEKTILQFLNLLLDTNERENILIMLGQIVDLTPEKRNDLANILQSTRLEQIVDTIKYIENRQRIIESLKKILKADDANERNHIQKIIEQNYWIFGDQYILVSADKNMKQALLNYRSILNKNENEENLDDDGKKRRMDIFLCGTSETAGMGYDTQENLIIELKAPSVVLNRKVYRQLEDYALYIKKQPEFNSTVRNWRFISVCNEIDEDIKSKRNQTFRNTGEYFLTDIIDNNYKIYTMTWDDVFTQFNTRHSFMLKKLKFDFDKINSELDEQTLSSKAEVDELIEKII